MAEKSRWTYTKGSVAEGVALYEDHPNGGSLKAHSHHDSDPARGQSNAFDLVRLHKFGHLDTPEDNAKPVTERPSYRAMYDFAMSQPEVQAELVDDEFEDLGELAPEEQMPAEHVKGAAALARRICDVLKNPTIPRWLIPDYIERGVIALLVGKRGSYKSFIALDWAMRIATTGLAVYVISAEGGDFDRRAKAWWDRYGDERAIDEVPLYVVERRLNLSDKDGVQMIRQDCLALGIRPVLFVLDTFSKLSGGLDENENSAVKQFIGMLDNGLKRKETGFDATVLVVAHTGHSDDSRARGASALGADTDAEYIVKRNESDGTVQVTRERFKSSPELPPVHYRPDVVDLGYPDGAGRNVTSLVLERVEREVEAKGKRREPRGVAQRAMYAVIQRLAPDGRALAVGDVAREFAALQAARPDGKGRARLDNAYRALNGLVAEEFAFFSQGETMVSLTRAEQILSEFDEELPE